MSRFVDTNILVYAHDLDAGDRHDKAKHLVADLWESESPPVLSVQVLQEFYVNLVRKHVEAELAGRLVDAYSTWRVIENDAELLKRAIQSSRRWTVSLWDALIIEAARVAGAAELLSEDLNAGQDFDGVRVVNPFAI